MSKINEKFTSIEPTANSFIEGPGTVRLTFSDPRTYDEIAAIFAKGPVESLEVTQTFHNVTLDSASATEAVLVSESVEFATDFEPNAKVSSRKKKLSEEEIEQLRAEHKEATADVKTLTADKAKLEKANTSLTEGKVAYELKAKEAADKAAADNEELKKEVASLKEELKTANADIKAKDSSIAKLEKQVDKLNK